MQPGPLSSLILKDFDALPLQLQKAARWILDHPDDVALLSMRDQAQAAGVQPATMTRLAQRLGLDGYDAVRAAYAAAVRAGHLGFSGRADRQDQRRAAGGDAGLAGEMVAALAESVAQLGEPAWVEALTTAAATLAKARCLYVLGLRASFPMAWTVPYLLRLIGGQARNLEACAATLADQCAEMTADDAVLVFGFDPYTRLTVETIQGLVRQGVPVVAVTDSQASPLARLAMQTICVGVESPSFFRPMTPAFAVAETLATLVAGIRGAEAWQALRATESVLAEHAVHWDETAKRSKS